jgi:Flp pilus assembly protein TadD
MNPHDPQIPIAAAVSALRRNQPDVAVALLEPSLKRFAESAALRRILGAAYYRLGDYESSQVVLQQALSLDKSSALSYFLMGCTLAKLGQTAAAETHFRQARRLDARYGIRR